MRVLCVHGVGGLDVDRSWHGKWREAIDVGWRAAGGIGRPETDFVAYDDIFRDYDLGFRETLEAVAKLLGSGVRHGWDWFRGQEGVFDGLSSSIRWTAGMVVQWVENDELRARTRGRLLDAIEQFQPDVVLAHSLGSLIGYDTLTHSGSRGCLGSGAFVSLGSQIANPFVAGTFLAGRIEMPVEAVWYHLYNEHDDVFTAPIRLSNSRFTQVDTPFDLPGVGDHDALAYLTHHQTTLRLWSALAAPPEQRRFMRASAAAAEREQELVRSRRRALLVGIDEYPEERNRLEGCVNDVFLMSSVLQEAGFAPEQIRIVLNERATAEGIRQRLRWLLEGAADGDELVFYYSGHGIQLPDYGPAGIVDRVHECLAPCDFDGRTETAVSDAQIYDLYSQLPYETRFVMILDCCHAGGVTRGVPRVKGLDPPDDIRHRMLAWDAERQVWRPREFTPLTPQLTTSRWRDEKLAGFNRATLRLGRAMPLRQLDDGDYRRVRNARHHLGPFLPMIMQACRADEYAYEYRHGSTSYGAFTYILAKTLRWAVREERRTVTFQELVSITSRELKDELGYEQTAAIVGPRDVLAAEVPWSR